MSSQNVFDIDALVFEDKFVRLEGREYKLATPCIKLSAQVMKLTEESNSGDDFIVKMIMLNLPDIKEETLRSLHQKKLLAIFNVVTHGSMDDLPDEKEEEVKNG